MFCLLIYRILLIFCNVPIGLLNNPMILWLDLVFVVLINNCMPLYGCALWSLNSCVLKQLDVSPNRCLHHIRSLSCYCHANVFIMCQVCLISVFSSFISCFSLLPLIVMSLYRYVQFLILLVFHVIMLLVITLSMHGKEVVRSSSLNVSWETSHFLYGVLGLLN